MTLEQMKMLKVKSWLAKLPENALFALKKIFHFLPLTLLFEIVVSHEESAV